MEKKIVSKKDSRKANPTLSPSGKGSPVVTVERSVVARGEREGEGKGIVQGHLGQ